MSAMSKELQFIIALSKGVKVYARDHDGNFPAQLDEPDMMDNLMIEVGIENSQAGEVAKPWYLRGQNVESPADQILITSPWVDDGKRAVVFCNTIGRIVEESVFQKELATILDSGGRELVKGGEDEIQPVPERRRRR